MVLTGFFWSLSMTNNTGVPKPIKYKQTIGVLRMMKKYGIRRYTRRFQPDVINNKLTKACRNSVHLSLKMAPSKVFFLKAWELVKSL